MNMPKSLTYLFSEKEYYSETLILGVANVCNPARTKSYMIYSTCLERGMAPRPKMIIALLASHSFMCE